jgi:hypothetical protein
LMLFDLFKGKVLWRTLCTSIHPMCF